MRNPKPPFRKHPQNSGDKKTNREKIETNIFTKKNVRGKSDSYHSFAPETTYIVKRSYYGGFSLLIVSSLFLYFIINGFIKFGFSYILLGLFLIPLIVFIWGVFLIIKSILIGVSSNPEYKIIISNKGLNLENVFFNWSTIKNEKVLKEGKGRFARYYIFFEIPEAGRYAKFPIMDFEFSNSELEYLLKVYRSRYENKLILKKEKYERKYMNMTKSRKDKYIIG